MSRKNGNSSGQTEISLAKSKVAEIMGLFNNAVKEVSMADESLLWCDKKSLIACICSPEEKDTKWVYFLASGTGDKSVIQIFKRYRDFNEKDFEGWMNFTFKNNDIKGYFNVDKTAGFFNKADYWTIMFWHEGKIVQRYVEMIGEKGTELCKNGYLPVRFRSDNDKPHWVNLNIVNAVTQKDGKVIVYFKDGGSEVVKFEESK